MHLRVGRNNFLFLTCYSGGQQVTRWVLPSVLTSGFAYLFTSLLHILPPLCYPSSRRPFTSLSFSALLTPLLSPLSPYLSLIVHQPAFLSAPLLLLLPIATLLPTTATPQKAPPPLPLRLSVSNSLIFPDESVACNFTRLIIIPLFVCSLIRGSN